MILDNFLLIQAPAKAYFSLFISFFIAPSLQAFSCLSLLSTAFFHSLSPFCQFSHFANSHSQSSHMLFLSFLSSSVQPSFSIYVLIHFALLEWNSISAHYLESILTFGMHNIIFLMFLSVFNGFLWLLLPGEKLC